MPIGIILHPIFQFKFSPIFFIKMILIIVINTYSTLFKTIKLLWLYNFRQDRAYKTVM